MDNQTQPSEQNEPAVVKYNGPWSPHDECTNCITIRDAFGGFVADIRTEGVEIVPEMWTTARLIAAAPALLMALQTLLDDAGRVSLDVRENLMVWSGDREALHHARESARAAIAKATGSQVTEQASAQKAAMT